MENKELIKRAVEARKQSYSPYSGFQVGAALLTEEGEVFCGCNIENAAYGPCNCAERTAIFKAVSEGKRKFKKIAVVGGKKETGIAPFTAPCGVCRQVMAEFCNPDTFQILLCDANGNQKEFQLSQLLPMGFGPGDLE